MDGESRRETTLYFLLNIYLRRMFSSVVQFVEKNSPNSQPHPKREVFNYRLFKKYKISYISKGESLQ